MKKMILLFAFLLTLVITSCEKDNVSNETKFDGRSILVLGRQNDPVLQGYMNSFNWDDVTAVITLQKTFTNDMNGSTPYQEFTNNAYARFYDVSTGQKKEMGAILLNGIGMINIYNFSYQIPSDELSNLFLNYGSSTNNIYLSLDSNMMILDTNVAISSPIQLTNFTFNQNVSKVTNWNMTWSGSSSNSICQYSLLTHSDIREADTSSNKNKDVGINSSYINNNGSFTIEKEGFNMLRNGKTRILANKIEIKMLNMADGKKVCLVAVSTFDSYINITN